MASPCYNLESCQPNAYPSIFAVDDSVLAPYIDQLISFNGDPNKRYFVRETRRFVARQIENTFGLCVTGDVSPVTWQINSLIYEGTEYITGTAPTYNLNNGNLIPLNCTGTT